MQVEEFLELSARHFGDKTAVVCGESRLTYREIEEHANRLAHVLIREGVQRGDRVAIYLENSVEAVVSIFAVLKAGAVFVVVHPTTKLDRLTYILSACRVVALVTDVRKLAGVNRRSVQMSHLRVVLVAGRAVGSGRTRDIPRCMALEEIFHRSDGPAHPPTKRCIDLDLAALIYTSGSTGRPKGVMLTHLNIVSALTPVTTLLENAPTDVILNVLQLSFGYGLDQVLTAFKVGATVVLERGFAYPRTVIETLVHERVTGFPIVPMMAAMLLKMDLKKYDFSSLRYITIAGAALPPHHSRDLRRLLPDVGLYPMYALTECKRVSSLPPDQVDIRPTSVGKGFPNAELYIVDEEGQRVGPGIAGELVVRSSSVMKGYWELPEETDRVLKPGPLPWEKVLYTGDLFKRDEEGYLYFIGRKDDIIKSRGGKVSPKEVEDVLYALDGVAEAAVVGIPDPLLGQAVKAVVTLRDGARLTEQDLLRHCAQYLQGFMVPKIVEFRDSLPKTSTGKIIRRELRVLASEG